MPELCDSQKLLLYIISGVLLILLSPYIVILINKEKISSRLGWNLVIAMSLIGIITGGMSAIAETKLCDQVHIVEITCDSSKGDKGVTEVVILQNMDNHEIYLDGWKLCDYQNKHCYEFLHFTLEPQTSVELWTTIGDERNDTLYWNSKTAIWDDGKDTATLIDNKGHLVDQLKCPPPPTPTITPSPTSTSTPSATPTNTP